MAIYYFDLTPVRRSKGRNLVQLCAYVTAVSLKCWRTKKRFRRKEKNCSVVFEILGTTLSVEALANLAEFAEVRKDALLARHLIVAVSNRLSRTRQFAILMALGKLIASGTGCPVVVVLHRPVTIEERTRNDHGHLIILTRPWLESSKSFAAKKDKALDDLRISRPFIKHLRKQWEIAVNAELKPGERPVTCESHRARGLKRIPGRHLGRAVIARERRIGTQCPERELNELKAQHHHCIRKLTALELTERRLLQALEFENKAQLHANTGGGSFPEELASLNERVATPAALNPPLVAPMPPKGGDAKIREVAAGRGRRYVGQTETAPNKAFAASDDHIPPTLRESPPERTRDQRPNDGQRDIAEMLERPLAPKATRAAIAGPTEPLPRSRDALKDVEELLAPIPPHRLRPATNEASSDLETVVPIECVTEEPCAMLRPTVRASSEDLRPLEAHKSRRKARTILGERADGKQRPQPTIQAGEPLGSTPIIG